MHKLAIILGGTGLIGRTTNQQLLKLGWQTIIVDKRKPIEEISNFRHIDILKKGALPHLIDEINPDLVINSINIATLYSANPLKNYDNYIGFYFDLYHSLTKLNKSCHYIQVGTTGSGGLGFNIPFTHGHKIEDLPIIHKAAFAGISSGLLTLLSRSFDNSIQISEIKPGLAIFDDVLKKIEFEGTNCLLIDGGESGYYTYDELALLTSYMGFTTANTIVDKIIAIINKKRVIIRSAAYNLTETMNQTIITQTSADKPAKQSILKKMLRSRATPYLIATGNLGPPSLTRDLILAKLAHKAQDVTAQNFLQKLDNNVHIAYTLRYIKQHMPELYTFLQEQFTYPHFKKLTQATNSKLEPWEIVRKNLS